MTNIKSMNEALELTHKISRLLEKLNQSGSVISSIEKDMLLDYTRKLYDELLQSQEHLQTSSEIQIADDSIVVEDVPNRADVPVQEEIIPEIKLHGEEMNELIKKEEVQAAGNNLDVPLVVEQKISEERAKTISPALGRAKIISQNASLFDEVTVLADKFEEKETIHGKISKAKEDQSVAEKLSNMPLLDLKKSIGINEKFKFVNELFDGNLQDYNSAIDALNGFTSFNEAQIHIEQTFVNKYNWQKESGVYQSLLFLIQRKFNF